MLIKSTIRLFSLFIVFFILLGLLLPSNYEISKHIVIKAPLSKVSPWLRDLKHWQQWSPWLYYEKNRKSELSQPSFGVGAHQYWQNSQGSGELTVTSLSNTHLSYTSVFNQQTTSGEFQLSEHLSETKVSWSISGYHNMPIFGGYMSLYTQYRLNDAIVLGLRNLKSVIESEKGSNTP